MSIVTLPIPAPHTPKGEQSCFRSKIAMWVSETSVLFYHQGDGRDKLKAASLPICWSAEGAKLAALAPQALRASASDGTWAAVS